MGGGAAEFEGGLSSHRLDVGGAADAVCAENLFVPVHQGRKIMRRIEIGEAEPSGASLLAVTDRTVLLDQRCLRVQRKRDAGVRDSRRRLHPSRLRLSWGVCIRGRTGAEGECADDRQVEFPHSRFPVSYRTWSRARDAKLQIQQIIRPLRERGRRSLCTLWSLVVSVCIRSRWL